MKRIKRMLAFGMAAVMLVSNCPILTYAKEADGEKDIVQEMTEERNAQESSSARNISTEFTYKVLNGTFCEITGYKGETAILTIPDEIDGYIVQRIANDAFKGNKILESVVLPNTLETMGTSLFRECTALKNVQLNDGLAEISESAFYGCTALEKIEFPDSVTTIGNSAFYGCIALESIEFSKFVKIIGSSSFSGCSGLKEIIFSEGLETILSYAFENCLGIEKIEFPDSVKELASRAFYNCKNLTAADYPSGWTTVLDYNRNSSSYWGEDREYYTSPFEGCTALKKIEIEEGVTAIPKYAFRYQTSLEEVVLPESLLSIGKYAFDGSKLLKTVILPKNLELIDSYAFRGCIALENLKMPAGLKTINGHAFENCTGLKNVSLNGGLTSLGETHVFAGCTALEKIEIPETVTKINSHTFHGCTGLTEVILSENLETIYSYAFENCTSLERIDLPDSVRELTSRAFYNCTDLSEVGYPSGWTTVLDYNRNSNNYWGEGREYYTSPFEGCTALKMIEVDEGVTEVPMYAFRYQTGLEEVVLPESLLSIGKYAFDGASHLKTVILTEKLEVVGEYAFQNCKALADIKMPENLKTLGAYGFNGCSGLKEVSLSEGLTTLESYVFHSCSGLKKIEIPGNVTLIKNQAFKDCTGLTQVVLKEGLETIYSYAFENCSGLRNISFPDSVKELASRAFYNCINLEEAAYPSGWTTVLDYNRNSSSYWGEGREYYTSPFEGCADLKKIEVAEGVTEIPKHAFRYQTSLEEVILPESLSVIGAYAFDGCPILEKIWIDENVTEIGNNAFSGCGALTIHGVEGSYIQEYAANNTIPFSTELMVYPTGMISGLVQDPEGNGIEGVHVTLYDLTWDETGEVVTTDSEGAWNSTEVIIGHEYQLWFYHGDYNFKEGTQQYVIGEEAITSGNVTAEKRTVIPETAVEDFTYKTLNGSFCEVTGYTGTQTSIRIPSEIAGYTVQKIADNAFKNQNALTAVAFPETVEKMGNSVFAGCTALTEVRLNEGLDGIGEYTFDGCSVLENISLPGTIENIGNYAFRNCAALKTMVLPNALRSIGGYAFENCSLLTEVQMTEGLETIYSYAFYNCTGLESINIPDSVKNLASRAFYNCTNLSEIGYPSGWTTVLDYSRNSSNYWGEDREYYTSPFEGCTSLKKIEVEEGATAIPKYAFRYQTSLEEVVLPESLLSIGKYAFDGSKLLKTVILPKNLELIDSYAFRGCIALENLKMPDSLKTINGHAFENCRGLKEVILNEGLSTLGETHVFAGCTVLDKIEIPVTVTRVNSYTFYGCTGLEEVVLTEGLETIYSYAFENCTSLERIDLPDSVRELASRAFYNCTDLSEVGYPSGWTTVPDYNRNSNSYWGEGREYYTSPFEGCMSLKKVEVDEGVTEVPKYAFRYQTSMEEIVLPESLINIGKYAFDGSSHLKTVQLTEKLETIDEYAFYNCKALDTMEMPDSLKTVGIYGFYGCSGLKEVSLSEGLATLESYVFHGCSGITNVEIPGSVTLIKNHAFKDCTGLTQVVLKEGLETIYSYAFENCSGLRNISFPDSAKELAARAFYNCKNLANVSYPKGWTTVLDYSRNSSTYFGEGNENYESPFSGCSELRTMTVPEGVTAIPKYAFRYQKSLREVILPDSLEQIGKYAFDGCNALEQINLVEGLTEIPDYAFCNCLSFDVLTLPSTITSIGSHAFYNCTGLRMLNMNDALKSIGSYAFTNCDGLLSLVLNEGLESILANVFANCDNLTAVEIPTSVTVMDSSSFTNCAKLKIYCYSGTNAHMISEKSGYDFVLLDEHEHIYESTVETEAACTRGGAQIKKCTICGYNYIEVIDALDHEYSESVIEPTCTKEGYTLHQCIRCTDNYKDTYVKAAGHSFGDWNIDKAATVFEEGSMHRDCTVCGKHETQTIEKLIIDIENNENYGLAAFEVVHAQTLEPIENAQIFISTEELGDHTFATDENGQVSVTLPVGEQHISAYAEGCLVRNLTITVNNGINQIPQIGLSDRPAYDAKITSELMTLEEIEAAGIDTSDPANQHVYKYELKLEFEPQIDWESIIAYFNADGLFLGGFYNGPDWGPVGPDDSEEGEGDSKAKYILHYHVIEDGINGMFHTWCKEEEVEKGERAPLTYHPWRDNPDYVFDGWYEDPEFTKKIYAADIEERVTYVYGRWIYNGEDDDDEDNKRILFDGIKIPTLDGEEITVYPVSEYFYLIIRGEVKWLKEMFDVEMLVINNSQTDTLEDLTATLSLPEGLSLAAMTGDEQSLEQKIDHIAEGESETVHWYVRGDQEGTYSLEGRLQGTIMPFKEPIDDLFVAENQLHVWAGSAMRLHFSFPGATYKGDNYPITIELTNVSDIPLYNLNHMVQIEQGMECYYSDGTKKERIETSKWHYHPTTVFWPGDKMVIEATVNIFFESELIKHKLEKLIGMVDGAEQLIEAYDAVNIAIEATEKLFGTISGSSKAIKTYISSSGGSDDKIKMFEQLYDKISSLMTKYSKSDNKTMDAAVKLANSGISGTLNVITNDPGAWLKNHSVDDIRDLMKKVDALGNSFEDSGDDGKEPRKFDIFDSLRLIIASIPVKFVLTNVIMKEDEGNTTRIPWSYTVLPTDVRYFGVSNVSKLLMSYVQVIAGEVYDNNMPGPLQIIPGLDDPFNKDEAIKYIQATEDEIMRVQAVDTSGTVTFRSWIEPGNMRQRSLFAFTRNGEETAEPFLLSSDNENAVFEDGVLTFTGAGAIMVTPQSQTGGTLYVEDSEGNLYTYVINVVESHECAAGKQQVIFPPTEDLDGFAVKCCEICDEIMEVVTLHFEDCCEKHSFDEWVTESDATCMSSGMKARTCETCGTVEYDFTTTDKHTPGEWEIVKEATELEEGLKEQRCVHCGELLDSETIPVKDTGEPEKEGVTRLYGSGRYETGYAVADALKAALGVEKFEAVVVATGKNFADALAGSYLAVEKNAPILLTNGKADNVAQLHAYIKDNVTEGGKVYILGGEGAVPIAVDAIDGYDVVRLYGDSRYDTNLAILEEAGVAGDSVIVATGKTFADSLSASAAKLPILLVKPNTTLNDSQKAILADMKNIYIVGGEGAVSAVTEAELKEFGEVTRVFGASRYDTSVAIAKAFCTDVEQAVVASGMNFPDGLCGGPLAAALNAPLILTRDGKSGAAEAYVLDAGIKSGVVLGGTGALADETVAAVFGTK